MRIILDCDDVLFQCNQSAVDRLNQMKGTKYSLEDVETWGKMGNELDERLEFFKDPDFIRSLPIYPEAKEFVRELSKRAEVFFATSVEAACAGARVESMIKHFPEINPGNILIGTRKDILSADFLLDDGFHNICNAQVKYPVLFRRPWNRSVSGRLTVSSYKEFLALIDLTHKKPSRRDSGDISMLLDPSNSGSVVALVGPSGCGKTTIANQLVKSGHFELVRSYTTRPKRNEKDQYHFLTKEAFLKKKEACFFFETSCYNKQLYGTSLEDMYKIIASGKKALLVLDINGAIAMKTAFGDQCTNVFVKREKEHCIKSVLKRQLSVDETAKRLLSMDAEFKNEKLCDLTIYNIEY